MRIFGILNITADSFSDGGRFLDAGAAIAHARALLAEGADVIDIGAASSNPKSAPVSAETEIARLKPVLAALKRRARLHRQLQSRHATLGARREHRLFE